MKIKETHNLWKGDLTFEPKHVIKCHPFGITDPEGLVIHLVKKPNWIHRKFMTLFFGFEWEMIEDAI